jgi:hypothetical protein
MLRVGSTALKLEKLKEENSSFDTARLGGVGGVVRRVLVYEILASLGKVYILAFSAIFKWSRESLIISEISVHPHLFCCLHQGLYKGARTA